MLELLEVHCADSSQEKSIVTDLKPLSVNVQMALGNITSETLKMEFEFGAQVIVEEKSPSAERAHVEGLECVVSVEVEKRQKLLPECQKTCQTSNR